MKLQLGLILTLGLLAGPAAAQGTFSPGHKPSSGFGSGASQNRPATPSYGVPAPPSYGAAPRRPAGGYAPIVGPPEAPVAKPYQPYKPPNYAPKASKPCETSVYVGACDRK